MGTSKIFASLSTFVLRTNILSGIANVLSLFTFIFLFVNVLQVLQRLILNQAFYRTLLRNFIFSYTFFFILLYFILENGDNLNLKYEISIVTVESNSHIKNCLIVKFLINFAGNVVRRGHVYIKYIFCHDGFS